MNLRSYLLTSMIVLGLSGCEKQIDNPDVESFIDQLKTNSYSSWELPSFSPADIPALLKYRNETKIITNFPNNWISSLRFPECKLGMFVLWTIESIRAVEINSEYLVGRFPSQNPILALRDSEELKLVYDEKAHIEAAEAYNSWWNSFHIFRDKIKIDPLAKTDYKWH